MVCGKTPTGTASRAGERLVRSIVVIIAEVVVIVINVSVVLVWLL